MSKKIDVKFLSRAPRYLYSVIILAMISLLTLLPVDGSHSQWHLFPNADKVVHFIMFGALAAALVFDSWRNNLKINVLLIAGTTILSAGIGGVIEMFQDMMGVGRSGDFYDFLADLAGALVFALISGYLCTRCLKR